MENIMANATVNVRNHEKSIMSIDGISPVSEMRATLADMVTCDGHDKRCWTFTHFQSSRFENLSLSKKLLSLFHEGKSY